MEPMINRPPPPQLQHSTSTIVTLDSYTPSPKSHQSPGTIPSTAPASVPSYSHPHASSNGLQVRSCTTCRKRKVKCDKAPTTCSNCARAGIRCEYPAPGRKPRRPKEGASARETELLKRLRKLEGVVDELSGQIDVDSSRQSRAGSAPTPTESVDTTRHSISRIKPFANTEQTTSVKSPVVSPAGTDTSIERDFGRLVVDEGKSRYVSNTFWASMAEEVEDIRDMLYDDEESEDEMASASPESSNTGPDKDHHSFILGYASSGVDLRQLHPLPSQVLFYWQTFKENIHPLTGLLHVPSMDKAILEIKDNLDGLARSTEALIFSIYYAVLTSLSDDQVIKNLGEEKRTLLLKYRFATEQALARANFLNTSELVTLQAFVLFLVCVRRHDDSRFVWTLTGLAIRIGQSLGLHRDGTTFGLPPFDVEMRRRLFWHMMILDVRSSEDHGSSPSIMDYDTKFPLNIHDTDITPEMTEPPPERTGLTDLTFSLMRYEIIRGTRSVLFEPASTLHPSDVQGLSVEEKEDKIRRCYDILDRKYLRYCDGAGPLYESAATIARLIISKMSLVIYHPFHKPGGPSELSYEKRTQLFIASTNIIEYSQTLQNQKETQKWGWLFSTYVQWHAIAFILGELCVRDRDELVERARRAIDYLFKDWQDQVSHSKNGMLWLPMRKLMFRAQKKWQADNDAREVEDVTQSIENNHVYTDHTMPTPQESVTSTFTSPCAPTTIGDTPPYTGDYAFVPSIERSMSIAERRYQQQPRNHQHQQQQPRNQQHHQQHQPSAEQYREFVPLGDPLNANGNHNGNHNAIYQPQDFEMDLMSADVDWQAFGAMMREFPMDVDNSNPDISISGGGNMSWW